MANNKDLNKAAKNKKDEFYTQLTDIEKELRYYKPHFKDKIVFCNCDDPETSNFWKYFELQFDELGIKKLISTHYETEIPSYKLELMYDINGDGKITNKDIIKTPLRQNGDFRSPECIEILKEADIIVTNPPFSLFREYIAQLLEYNKKFLIIGNINCVKYQEIFPYIMANKIWLGQSIHSGDREFSVPDSYPLNAAGCRVDENGKKYIRVKGVRWITNLEYSERYEDIPLFKHYTPEEFPKYDNYDAIEVGETKNIPVDYDGIMGVPITFIDRFNPNQFDLLGMTDRQNTSGLRTKKYTFEDVENFNDLNASCVLLQDGKYKSLYTRFLIRRKQK